MEIVATAPANLTCSLCEQSCRMRVSASPGARIHIAVQGCGAEGIGAAVGAKDLIFQTRAGAGLLTRENPTPTTAKCKAGHVWNLRAT